MLARGVFQQPAKAVGAVCWNSVGHVLYELHLFFAGATGDRHGLCASTRRSCTESCGGGVDTEYPMQDGVVGDDATSRIEGCGHARE